MINYLLRRVVYGILILLGVNLITFVLFFAVNTPDDMARLNLGGRRVTADAIEAWKAARGLDKPLFINTAAEGVQKITDTVFFERSVPLFSLISAAATRAAISATKFQPACGPLWRLPYRLFCSASS